MVRLPETGGPSLFSRRVCTVGIGDIPTLERWKRGPPIAKGRPGRRPSLCGEEGSRLGWEELEPVGDVIQGRADRRLEELKRDIDNQRNKRQNQRVLDEPLSVLGVAPEHLTPDVRTRNHPPLHLHLRRSSPSSPGSQWSRFSC